MVITFPRLRQPVNGPRPINLSKDVPQVIALLELVFGEKLGANGRYVLNNVNLGTQTPFSWRLNMRFSRLAPGVVWEENGRIIANATLLPTRSQDRFIVVNVAVHPDYRRRGIARLLMEAIMDLVRARQGKTIILQVVKDNLPAIKLYESLQFQNLGSITNWYATASQIHTIHPTSSHRQPPVIRELRAKEWQQAHHLDSLALSIDLNWPEPPQPTVYKRSLRRRVDDFLNGRAVETWVTTNRHGQLTGLATINSQWGRIHQLLIRIHPQWRGELERPLLAKLLRRLRYLPRRNVRLDYPFEDTFMDGLLYEANFQPRRTLTHMRWEQP